MELVVFFPKYPSIEEESEDLFTLYDEPFSTVIVSKKELSDLTLPKVEPIPPPGGLFNHQKIIARFLASVTPYDSILLFMEMGTGKTCTAIAAIEQIRYEPDTPFVGALIFARGKTLLKNFHDELLFKCTGGRYIPDNYDTLTEAQRVVRTRKITGEYYTFNTFERLAKALTKLTDQAIRSRYSNHIIVIDEVHNIRLMDGKDEEDLNIYNQFYRLIHTAQNCKVILMSGTVMTDLPEEFASIMNLILPKRLEFNVDTFVVDFFQNNRLRKDMVSEFAKRVTGRVSYLKAASSTTKKVFQGEKLGDLEYFKVWPTTMSDFQSQVYVEAYRKDKVERGIFGNSRQASLFVYPDGSYGSNGYKKYIIKKKFGGITRYILDPVVKKDIDRNGLEMYSSKYADIINQVQAETHKKTFIYCEYVHGSGLILLSLLFQHYGYTPATGRERTKGKRYAILTTETASEVDIQRIINAFNETRNVSGEYISVILGSRVIGEGVTLKNVEKAFITTPHWNYSITAQVIARAWRVGSHIGSPPGTELDVYQCVSIPRTDDENEVSIDLHMYEISETKDVRMKAIEYAVKVTAFDCPLNLERNKVLGYDGERQCDYKRCQYKCRGKFGEEDVVTYNLYHSLEGQVGAKLQEYFKTRFSITINQIHQRYPMFTPFEVIKSLKNLIEKNVVFYNVYGFGCYIREQNDMVFLTRNIDTGADFFTNTYARDPVVTTTKTFSELYDEVLSGNLKTNVDKLFAYPEHTADILTSIDQPIQLIILQGAILAQERGIQKHVNVRSKILSYFQSNYMDEGDRWLIILGNKTVCRTKGTSQPLDEWTPCNPRPVVSEKRDKFLASPIGYYGMYNPQKDIFCIRDVRDYDPDTKDLRKLKVGKMCKNYVTFDLTDIAARRAKIDPPSDFLQGKTREELQAMLKNTHSIDTDFSQDVSDLEIKRVLYWGKMTSSRICTALREWFVKNDLIEDNLQCGQQRKRRGEFR